MLNEVERHLLSLIKTCVKNLDKFAKSTGIAKEELHKLLDTNPIAAINLVISKLVDKSGGSATELVKLLGELGLKGAWRF
jgi:hypothetical protein